MSEETDDPHILSPKERDAVSRAFCIIFGSARHLSEGIYLAAWATGPKKGQIKPRAAVQQMIERGLLEVRKDDRNFNCAFFTAAGLQALRRTMEQNRRFLSSKEYDHIRDALGLA